MSFGLQMLYGPSDMQTETDKNKTGFGKTYLQLKEQIKDLIHVILPYKFGGRVLGKTDQSVWELQQVQSCILKMEHDTHTYHCSTKQQYLQPIRYIKGMLAFWEIQRKSDSFRVVECIFLLLMDTLSIILF